MIQTVRIPVGHIFCGIGGGAKGFNRGTARVGNLRAKFECLGGIDVDAGAIACFNKIASVRGTVLDLFSRDQYSAFHGHEPPPDWREAMPVDIQRAFQFRTPWILFLSAPCKGFSGLLSEAKSKSARYQALNELTLRGIWLAMEAYKDDPPMFVLFENVPRIQNRGRHLLDQIVSILQAYGYATAETTHDCGELGGLAQSRKRFLLVARHTGKVKSFLYEPAKKRLRAVGDVLEKLPLPGDPAGAPMHRMPALHWKTWVRLAFVEAGSDWRSLNQLKVKDGMLKDYALVPEREWQPSVLGVRRWEDTTGTIAGRSSPTNGAYSVADPRVEGVHHGVFGVTPYDDAAGVVRGASRVANGRFAVADPRIDGHHKSVQHGVLRMSDSSGVVTGKMFVGGGYHAVADPRLGICAPNIYRVVRVNNGDLETSRGLGIALRSERSGQGSEPHPIRVDQGRQPRYPGPRPAAERPEVSERRPMGRAEQAAPAHRGPSARPDDVSRSVPGRYGRTSSKWAPVGQCVDELGLVHTRGQHRGQARASDDRARGEAPQDQTHRSGRPSNPSVETQLDGRSREVWRELLGRQVDTQSPHLEACNVARVADPRPVGLRLKDTYLSAAAYGVVPWDGQSYAVNGHPKINNGAWSVADPRALPAPSDRLVALIVAEDGTWHRPFTTLELAALQSLVDPEEMFTLEGVSDSQHREWIGNCVPPDAAEGIANVMGRAVLLTITGETFCLDLEPVWVRPIAIALQVAQAGAM